jgi:hypothetical protein
MTLPRDDAPVGVTKATLIKLGIGIGLLAGSLIAASTICYACMNPAFPG